MKGAFDAAQKQLQNARNDVVAKKEQCKRELQLKCDKCKELKCKEAENNCKGFLDKAGKWIGGVVDKVGRSVNVSMETRRVNCGVAIGQWRHVLTIRFEPWAGLYYAPV